MRRPKSSLSEIAELFIRLGCTSFGGPAVHIAMMREEVVHKKKWMDEQHFLDLVGATNLIPGPNSTEMAIHIGREQAGWKGLFVAGFCFILPAVFITGVIALFYKEYGQLPQVKPFFYGIQPAIIAVILGAVYPLAKKALKNIEMGVIGIATLTLCLAGYHEMIVMFGAGFVAMIIAYIKNNEINTSTKNIFPFTILQAGNTTLISMTNTNLFFTFLKIGAILYGSGYVLFAFLDNELVTRGILSRGQLIDAIAVGQFTPGPVFSSVTFIGYQINGLKGAVVSTIGIFLPSFVFVALLNPFVAKMRSSALFSSFLDAVNIASIAIILIVCYTIGKESIRDWRTILIAVVSILLTFGFRKLNSLWIILGSSLTGYLLTLI